MALSAKITLSIDDDGDPVLSFETIEKATDLEQRLLNRFFSEGSHHGLELTIARTWKDSAEQLRQEIHVAIGPRTV